MNEDADAGACARGRSIDQRAAGHLARHRDRPAEAEREADLGLGPSLAREIDRDERAEAGLDIGDEEDEPVEPALAALRCADAGRRPRAVTIVGQMPCACGGGGVDAGRAGVVVVGGRRCGSGMTDRLALGLYSGAIFTSARLRSSFSGVSTSGRELQRRQSTAILRVPTPRKPPKSITAARGSPSHRTARRRRAPYPRPPRRSPSCRGCCRASGAASVVRLAAGAGVALAAGGVGAGDVAGAGASGVDVVCADACAARQAMMAIAARTTRFMRPGRSRSGPSRRVT